MPAIHFLRFTIVLMMLLTTLVVLRQKDFYYLGNSFFLRFLFIDFGFDSFSTILFISGVGETLSDDDVLRI
jgi:hypothetical protein